MTELVIHIGDPKTGTTSIQKALHKGIVDCHGRTILPWKAPNAISKARCLLRDDKHQIKIQYKGVRDWLKGRNEDIAVLSSESFAMVRPGKLQTVLDENLPEHAASARIISYVRPHPSRFLAAYVQRTKTGQNNRALGEFLQHVRRNGTLQYTPRFNRWRRVFGDRFALYPFVRTRLRGEDIVQDFFFRLLGDENFSASRSLSENISVKTRALSGLQLVHEQFAKAGMTAQQRALVGNLLANFFLPKAPAKGDKPRLDRTTTLALIDMFRQDARNLDRAFFGENIMLEGLETALNDAVDEPLDLDPSRYFTSSEMSALIRLGEEAAMTFLSDPAVCNLHFRDIRGHVKLGQIQKKRLALHRRRLGGMDSRLNDIADILRG